ncbi:MAG: phosphocholine cytidylyltransferase family protein [Chloroflexota bacterium]
MIETAIILAAGKGERLTEIWADKPKGFIQIGNLTLIERTIKILKQNHINRLLIITGYEAEYYETLSLNDDSITTIKNNNFATTGNMASLVRANKYLSSDFFLIEADIVFEERAISELQNTKQNDVILISQFTHAGDEVYVDTSGLRVVKLSKKRAQIKNCTGELVGISKISYNLFQKMVQHYCQNPKKYCTIAYEDCLNKIMANTVVQFHKINDLLWGEIDTPNHFERITKTIYPAIARKESKVQ